MCQGSSRKNLQFYFRKSRKHYKLISCIYHASIKTCCTNSLAGAAGTGPVDAATGSPVIGSVSLGSMVGGGAGGSDDGCAGTPISGIP